MPCADLIQSAEAVTEYALQLAEKITLAQFSQTLRIHGEDAILAGRLEAVSRCRGFARRSADFDDLGRGIADRVGAAEAGDRSGAGNGIARCGPEAAGRQRVDVGARGRRRISGHGAGLGSVIVAHNPPLSWRAPRAFREHRAECCVRISVAAFPL